MGIAVRLFDLVVSIGLLILASPVFAIVAVLIKIDSPGPVFFLQERVGRGWRRFKMLKFRKMYQHVPSDGPGITGRFDARVTRVGSWLERTKLDELPQLINVLIGDMSVVGPRPEIPKFTGEPHRDLWDRVLRVKPGIFGPNQITNRNEAEMYPEECADLERYYLEHILPRKLEIDAAYAERKSLGYDIWILLLGIWVSLAGIITRETIRTRRWQVAYLLGCLALAQFTLIAAFFLRFNWSIPATEMNRLRAGMFLMLGARLVSFLVFRVHRTIHAYLSLSDALNICGSVAVGSIGGIAAQMLLNIRAGVSRSVFIVDGVLLTVAMIGMSYVIDRGMEMWKRNKQQPVQSLVSRVLWGAIAGIAGALAMLYSLALVWPTIFVGHGADLVSILLSVFAVRLVLFPFLLGHLGPTADFIEVVTTKARRLVEHVVLAFTADITMAFFLNVRGVSRGAVIVNAAFYGLLLLAVLSLRGTWVRRHPALASARPTRSNGAKRVLVVGDGREASLMVAAIKAASHAGIKMVGVVTANPANRTRHIGGVEILGTPQNLPAILAARQPTVVVVLQHTMGFSAFRRTMRFCRDAGVPVRLVPSIERFLESANGADRERLVARTGVASE